MQFKINNKTWEIKELSQEEIKQEMKRHFENPVMEGKYFGITYSDIQTIYLDKDLCNERKRSTLLHELTHCYIETFITHLSRSYSDEDVCDIVSNSHDIIRDIVDEYFKEENHKWT